LRKRKNYKAFLTREGTKLVDERKIWIHIYLPLNQMLSRETITRDVNRVMRSVSENLPDQPYITSQSFRVGYITYLWKDTKDIEFVKQTIDHRSMGSTS